MPTEAPFWAPPLLAVQFLTRVPVATSSLSPEQVRDGLVRAVAWFPLVGAGIGAATAAVALAAHLVWPAAVAVLVALIVEARLTGAFHEDAVADFCDAFGGGQTADDVRRIMKDSRIGSYGALGLALAVGLRAALTIALLDRAPWHAAATIVAAATFGRLLVVAVMASVAPAPAGTGLAKDIGGIGRGTLGRASVAALPGLALFALMDLAALAGSVVAALIFIAWFRALLLRRIGGSTGDCLGFAAYAGQLIVLLAATA